MNLYIYEETSSTNDLAKKNTFKQGDIIWAYSQTLARGQRGNTWTGESKCATLREPWIRYGLGRNAAFSVVVEPRFLAVREQFLISQISALALCTTLLDLGIEARIKWTNDIYVGDKKIAGVLIENSLSNGVVAKSVIGIGLNVNQIDFDPKLPNPTSMRIESDKCYDREALIRQISARVLSLLDRAKSGDFQSIREKYLSLLYRSGEEYNYSLADGTVFAATLEGVGNQGELQLRHSTSGNLQEYLFREVEFIIKGRKR